MITKEQREKLDELIDDFADATADYVDSRGDGELVVAVDASKERLSDFLGSITEGDK